MDTQFDFLTVKEAAAILHCSTESVCRQARAGQFPGAVRRRAGRSFRWLLPRRAVLTQLEIYEPEDMPRLEDDAQYFMSGLREAMRAS